MEYISTLSAIFIANIILMVTPGPNVLLIAQTSAIHSRRSGIITALGVVTMGFIWPGLAIVGLSFIFQKMTWLYAILRLIGSFYLIYLGFRSWRSATKPIELPMSSSHLSGNRPSFFMLGFFTSLSNPKILVFMGSFLAAMLPANSPDWFKILVIAMFGINSLWWHTLVAYAFSTSKIQHTYSHLKSWLERITGGIFFILGIRLALSSE